jgi:diguanylate cyclase (GGDEF)-like protein
MAVVERIPQAVETPNQSPVFGLVTRLAVMNTALVYLATHDPLTGLLNKAACNYEIEKRMAGDEPIGIIELDLDGFKLVNDTIGHPEGDRLLQDFGTHLRSKFRRAGEVIAHETVVEDVATKDDDEIEAMGRTGGDEFIIVVGLGDRGRNDSLTPIQRMNKGVRYTRSVIDEFVEQQDSRIKRLKFNASMGIAIYRPRTDRTPDDMVKRADAGVRRDKLAHGAPAR